MKNLFISLIINCLAQVAAFGQVTHNHSVSFGFITDPEILTPLTGNRWLVVGRGEPRPGSVYRDTVFFLILDAEGQILKRQVAPVPAGERHSLYGGTGLRDGGFAFSFESGQCDVVGEPVTLLRFGSGGNLLWQKTEPFGSNQLPQKIYEAPDGHLIGRNQGYIVKINAATGDEMWRVPLPGANTAEMAFLPQTEDYVVVRSGKFEVWKRTAPTGTPNYALVKTVDLAVANGIIPNHVVVAPSGDVFARGFGSDGRIVKIDTAYQASLLPYIAPRLRDMVAQKDGLFVLSGSLEANRLDKIDFDGHLLRAFDVGNRWQYAALLAVRDSNVALAGWDLSARAWMGDTTFYESKRNLWFGAFSGLNPPAPTDMLDARVAEVIQTKPVKAQKFTSNLPPNVFYTLSGGGFRVRLEHNGSEPLEYIEVNTRFKLPANAFICPETPAIRKIYRDPDGTTWLNFGDIQAQGQPEVPAQFCFWTSAPNQRPDANHDNDAACVGIILDDEEPAAVASLQVFPNPATKWLTAQAGRTFSEKDRWEIFDLVGRRVAEGDCPAGTEQLEIPVGELPDGIFCLKIGGQARVFQVHH